MYCIDKTEVTNCAICSMCDGRVAGCTPPANNSSWTRPSYYNNATYANYPVIWVNWSQANAYCHWVGSRLPTEAEWEKAAGGGRSLGLPLGRSTRRTCSLANYWPGPACVGDTSRSAVISAGASPYGALDMAGNVSEWVNDWFSGSYYSVSPPINPPGLSTGFIGCCGGAVLI